MLDAVDTYTDKFNMYGDHFEAASAIKFRLGGTVYIAIENPADGYRSMMKKLRWQLIPRIARLPISFLLAKCWPKKG